LKNAIRRGTLLDTEAVETEWKSILLTEQAGVMRLPQRAGDRLGLTVEQVRRLDQEARAVLSELGKDVA
jgi:hypothetical protein